MSCWISPYSRHWPPDTQGSSSPAPPQGRGARGRPTEMRQRGGRVKDLSAGQSGPTTWPVLHSNLWFTLCIGTSIPKNMVTFRRLLKDTGESTRPVSRSLSVSLSLSLSLFFTDVSLIHYPLFCRGCSALNQTLNVGQCWRFDAKYPPPSPMQTGKGQGVAMHATVDEWGI